MVKIKDIAVKCKTSIATVSKALHNSHELSPETIKRVQSMAKEMGYVPNAFAQALKMKKSFSIGVIFSDPTAGGLRHEYFSAILDSFKVEAESHGYNITFLSKNPVNNMSYLQMAKYRNMDGVAIVSESFDNPEVIELANSTIPVVTIDYVFNSSTAILSDNSEGMEKLVRYVIGLNHRRIAYIHGELTDVTRKRLAGFHKGIKAMDLHVPDDMIIQGRFHDPAVSGRATKALMSRPDHPTFIFYPDDVSMLGGLSALSQLHLRVPEDISIAGYDGVEISQLYRPPFTTYIQNSTELGKQAALNLVERIENPSTFSPKIIFVQGKIQEGGTAQPLEG